MQSNPQIFTLPTMPFRRDIPTGCPVGTTIQLTGKPFQDVKKEIQFMLTTNNNDIALRCDLVLGDPSKVRIDCVVSQKTSTAIENLIVCPYNQRAVLKVVTLQHSFQILFNGSKIADFVHRVDPTLIKTVTITGPMITEEVVITPAVAATLPTYQQATSPPTDMFRNMNLGENSGKVPLVENDLPPPPPGILNATAPPLQMPMGNMPMPPQAPPAPPAPATSNTIGSTSAASSSFYYTGGSQGFSNHPYPLPGLIDNKTYPSQQNGVGQLPATSIPSAPPVAPPLANPVPAGTLGAAPVASPYATTPITASTQNVYTPAPTPSVPYTVTYPQSASSTPAIPQPIPQPVPQQSHIYQNQGAAYNPYPQGPPLVPTGGQVPLVPIPGPTSAAIPVSAMQPQLQYPATYMYPTATPMVQPYPVYQQYPMGYGYAGPEVIYYEGGHHHHHRHHFFGHHHHHCD